MKKNLLAFLLCIVGLHGAYATDFSASYVSETDTAEHITLIKDLKIDPHNPTENDEIFLRSHLMTNSSYKQQVRIVKDTIFINGSFSRLSNSVIEYTVITDSLGILPAGRYILIHYVKMLGELNEVVQEMTKNLQFSVEKFGEQVVDTNRLDTGTVVTPVVPSKPTIYVPTIHKGDNVTEYPHNPAVDEMLSSVKPAQQEFTMTIEGDYLRIKGTLFARGYDKHYIHCQIIGDSVHLERFDMDPESTDMLPHYVDIRIPGFTEDYYHVTLAEQNDVPLYKQYMVMSRRVKRNVSNIETFSKESLHIKAIGSTLLCTSPNATKLEVYTMDAVKVGETAFTNGEATVKVDKIPATYLYIVTYPNGSRESGKAMVK